MRTVSLSSLVVLIGSCSGPPAPPPTSPRGAPPAAPAARAPAPAAPAPAPLAGDTTITTPTGATLVAPKGWWLSEAGGAIVLADPDRAITATILATPEADPAAATAAAWQRVRPGFARAIQRSRQPPPSRGWQAATEVDYETRADEHRVVRASARRYRDMTYVALIEGDAAAVERRGAQLDTALGTLTPPGMQEESFAGTAPRPIDAARAAALDAFIADARERLAVPGAAVAVIAGGKVAYERSVGVRALGRPEPITPGTLFLLASVTKPLTTLMQAALVDAGTLTWDTPVTRLLPGFALGDPEVTRKLQLWHMSCACTGMPRRDLDHIFEYAGVTAEARVASMKTMTPTTGFGETYQYSNLMVAAGGFAAAHAADPARSLGAAYDRAMRARVFGPIGMASSTVDFDAAARAEHALPHATAVDGAVQLLPLAIERNVVPIAPAGAAWSNLRDMERYVQTELGKGVAPGGARVVSEANVTARWAPRVRAGESSGYGLGIGVGTLHGLAVIDHDGGAFGYGTSILMLPEVGVGIVILTNVRNGGDYEQLPFNTAVKRKVLEVLFDGAGIASTSVAYYAASQREAAAAAQLGLDRAPDLAWQRGLAGRYRNPSLGVVELRAGSPLGTFDAGEWQLRFGRRIAADGTVTLVFVDPPFAGAALVVGGDPAHPTLTVPYGQVSYVLERAR
jgi:CubicO group peptidase (beta-lactamase class C family)